VETRIVDFTGIGFVNLLHFLLLNGLKTGWQELSQAQMLRNGAAAKAVSGFNSRPRFFTNPLHRGKGVNRR